ncbi:type II toxin-antitoxin system RelE/ParE family toxin [Colwellia sp. MSW7]|jgi:putative addiction module killer protein|uniref:Type II toxin-antitoxin system RelE/ParE family toxin n=1 Tax=Colwellia maritima TaxID=2912588 RepID=A0ABS9X5H6_9GAMM|nr:type II toxin-antitoxin system RelE/ParE family toxin [Colwellia maritima]MCI2285485.1 type II toxin-antitoxin system RelE/ParE family toxin [Colwellia maritima]
MKYEVKQTSIFKAWLKKLKDRQALKIIALRLTRAVNGNLGDVKSLGSNLSEMRIFVGKGYRLYFTIKNGQIIVLLCGGDKSSQSKDIEKAKKLLNELDN